MHPLDEQIQTNYHEITPGDWFVPVTIKGVDQHDLIGPAIKKGASGFIIEQGRVQPKFPFIEVPDLRDYLFERARRKRERLEIASIAIAGSAGKTSVKELLGAIVTAWEPTSVHMSPANQNTKIALATQILRLPSEHTTAIFEVGARRLGDFQIPLSFLSPSVVALLNMGQAHIGEFGSLTNLHREKLSILQAPTAKSLVVLGDDELLAAFARKTRRHLICFGFDDRNDVQIVRELDQEIHLKIHGRQIAFSCPWSASAKSLNIAAAVALSLCLDIPLSSIQKGIETFQGVGRRFQIFDWNGVEAIDDAFNASPESLVEGLKALRHRAKNRKTLLVIGSILELGEMSHAIHRDLAGSLSQIWGDLSSLGLATVGREAQAFGERAVELGLSKDHWVHFSDSDQARNTLCRQKRSFDLVYFKGSKGIELKKIFEA